MKRFNNYIEQFQEQKKLTKTQLTFVGFVMLLFLLIALTLSNYLLKQQQTLSSNAASLNYTASTDDFPNPERGFFTNYLTTDAGTPISASTLQAARAKNITLVRRVYIIPGFRTIPLSQSFLDMVNADMSTARANGVKYIVRFAYNFDAGGKDATSSMILNHLTQLKPILTANSDVISHVEAGFIGEWGEWHDSSSGLITTPAMTSIVNGLLDALPKDRSVQLRYNYHKRAIFGDATLTSSEAFTGTNKSRVGHNNDCFLASADDWGTYWDSLTNWSYEQQKDYLHEENQYVPQSGETCNVDTTYTNCTNALKDLTRMRWSALNNDYEPNVLAGWVSGGCMSDIQKRLGYRLRLVNSNIIDTVKPGGTFTLSATITNDGFASPFNARKLEIILRNKTTKLEYFVTLSEDPRRWLGGTTSQFSLNAGLPENIPTGAYDVLLNLPDPKPTLYNKPEFSIRLANQNIWEANTGYNSLLKSITVDASASGTDYTGTTFFQTKNGSTPPNPTPTAISLTTIPPSPTPATIAVTNTPMPTPTIAPYPSTITTGISQWSGHNNAKKSYYGFTYSGNPKYIHAFLDTDNNPSTGYRLGGIGSDYMLENRNLFRYTGTNGGWGWAVLTRAGGIPKDNTISWTVSRSLVRETTLSSATVVFQTNDSNGTPLATTSPYSHVFSQASGPITAYWADNNATMINYHATISPLRNFNHVYIDSDEITATGYNIGGIGANYMIENNTLYRYTGVNGGWGWASIGNSNQVISGNNLSWSVNRTSINAVSSTENKIIFNGSGGNSEATSNVYRHVFTQ